MNITNILTQFLLFSFISVLIAFILGLITTEERPQRLKRIILRNLGFIYITVFILGIFAVVLPLIF